MTQWPSLERLPQNCRCVLLAHSLPSSSASSWYVGVMKGDVQDSVPVEMKQPSLSHTVALPQCRLSKCVCKNKTFKSWTEIQNQSIKVIYV